jgi:hypothetical protein
VIRKGLIGFAAAASAIWTAGCGASGTAPTVASTAVSAPKTIATFSGSGIKTTPDFTVPAEWVLNWTYSNCAGGGSGNFAVVEYHADGSLINVLANELGTGSSGTNNQHADGGSRYLTISSECPWTVTVVG